MPISSAAGARNLLTNGASIRPFSPFMANVIISGGLLCGSRRPRVRYGHLFAILEQHRRNQKVAKKFFRKLIEGLA
jgi:hypothetical protein